MAKKSIRNLESIIADGEATGMLGGFKGQTVNGSVRYQGGGWNREHYPDEQPTPEDPMGGAWQPGSNRTGE